MNLFYFIISWKMFKNNNNLASKTLRLTPPKPYSASKCQSSGQCKNSTTNLSKPIPADKYKKPSPFKYQRPVSNFCPSLHAKSILYTITEQSELNLLKKQTLEQVKPILLVSLRKCSTDIRYQLAIIFLNLCRKLYVDLGGDITWLVDEVADFLVKFVADEEKLIKLILFEEICQIMIYFVSKSSENSAGLIHKLNPLIQKMRQLQSKGTLIKKMPKKDYQLFLKGLQYWNKKFLIKYDTQLSEAKLTESVLKDGRICQLGDQSAKIEQQVKLNSQNYPASMGMTKSQNRNSNISNHSNLSELSQAYRIRLKKFDQTKQNQQFKRYLQIVAKGKRKRPLSRCNSFKQGSMKRVSTTWGRQDSVCIQIGANQDGTNRQFGRKGDMTIHGSKTYKNGQRKSISIFKKQQSLLEKNLSIQIDKSVVSNSQNFEPFYIYTIIKGNIRIITVEKAQILQQTNKLKLIIRGYFNHSLIFHKFHSSFSQSCFIQAQRLKKFMLANMELKQTKISTILYPKLKIQPEHNEQITRNVISELLPQKEKYIFYGFIKNCNVYFFSKYQIEEQNDGFGVLDVYDVGYEDRLERVGGLNWGKPARLKSKLPKIQIIKQCEDVIQNNLQKNRIGREVERYITISQFKLKTDTQPIKTRYKNKMRIDPFIKFKKKLGSKAASLKQAKNTIHITTRKPINDHHQIVKSYRYHVLSYNYTNYQSNFNQNQCKTKSKSINYQKLICSNLLFQHKYYRLFLSDNFLIINRKIRNLQPLRQGKLQNTQNKELDLQIFHPQLLKKQKLSGIQVQRLRRSKHSKFMTNINRRIGKPYYVKVLHQFSFVKKVVGVGYVVCKIFVFDQKKDSQFIITQVFLNQNQKYYTFPIKSALIARYLPPPRPHKAKNSQLSILADLSAPQPADKSMSSLLIKFQIKKVPSTQTQSGEFGLALTIDGSDSAIFGEELFYRWCVRDQQCNVEYLESLALGIKKTILENDISQGLIDKNSRKKADVISSKVPKTQNFHLNKNIYRQKFLYNQINQVVILQNNSIYKKYSRYNEFIKALKSQMNCFKEDGKTLDQKIKKQKFQNLFKKSKNQYYYKCMHNLKQKISKGQQNEPPFRISSPQPTTALSPSFTTLKFKQQDSTCTVTVCEPIEISELSSIRFDVGRIPVASLLGKLIPYLKGKALFRYMGRFLRDPNGYQILGRELRGC